MKILVKNKKWYITFENFNLICDVKWETKEEKFYIKFKSGNKLITIKSKNIDKTLKELENSNSISGFIFN